MTLTTTLQDKIHNEARMRWETEKSPSDPEWRELPTEEVSRRVEAVLADETLSLVELPPPWKPGEFDPSLQAALTSSYLNQIDWQEFARQQGQDIARTFVEIGQASPPQKDKTG